MHPTLAFIGGGNMASAILGGLRRAGRPADAFLVIEPDAPQAQRLHTDWGVHVLPAPSPALSQAALVVWAVKPQLFAEAAAPAAPWLSQALHLSVMAGVRSPAIARAACTQRVVRAMPNTPALIGQGISGLFARDAVTELDRAEIEAVLSPTGRTLWLDQEDQLDAVTALSGSGPAYFFYVVEAMIQAGLDLGLHATQARELALATCAGAAALALQSPDSVATLRERVTSKGGTTHAALASLALDGVGAAVQRAVKAADARAKELGAAFGD